MLVVENGVVGVGLDRLPFSICAAYSEKVVGVQRGEVRMWIGACGLPVKLYGIVLRMSCAQKNERKFKQRQPHRLPIREKVDWDKTLRPKYIKARSLSREGLRHRDNHLFGVLLYNAAGLGASFGVKTATVRAQFFYRISNRSDIPNIHDSEMVSCSLYYSYCTT